MGGRRATRPSVLPPLRLCGECLRRSDATDLQLRTLVVLAHPTTPAKQIEFRRDEPPRLIAAEMGKHFELDAAVEDDHDVGLDAPSVHRGDPPPANQLLRLGPRVDWG